MRDKTANDIERGKYVLDYSLPGYSCKCRQHLLLLDGLLIY